MAPKPRQSSNHRRRIVKHGRRDIYHYLRFHCYLFPTASPFLHHQRVAGFSAVTDAAVRGVLDFVFCQRTVFSSRQTVVDEFRSSITRSVFDGNAKMWSNCSLGAQDENLSEYERRRLENIAQMSLQVWAIVISRANAIITM